MSKRLGKSLQVFGCVSLPLGFLFLVFYPIFTNIRENAQTTTCHTNLKQLGTALRQYAQDCDDALPNISADGTRTWRECLLPYVKTKDAYHCPERRDTPDAHGFPQNYAASSGPKSAFAAPGMAPHTFKSFPAPGKLILLVEAENNPHPDFSIDGPAAFGPSAHELWAGHFKSHSSFLLADGHVKSLRPTDTYLYDPKNHLLFNFWYRNPETRLSANGEAVLKDTAQRFH